MREQRKSLEADKSQRDEARRSLKAWFSDNLTPAPVDDWQDAGRVFLSGESSLNSSLDVETVHRLISMAAGCKQETARTRKTDIGIIEFCCSEESEIGVQARRAGLDVLRVTKEMDCLSKGTVDACVEFIKSHDRVHMHGSLPCTSWSMIQFLNIYLHGLTCEERLRKARLLSLRQVAVFLIITRVVKAHRGTSSFEWPKNALGWDKPLVRQLLREQEYETALVRRLCSRSGVSENR